VIAIDAAPGNPMAPAREPSAGPGAAALTRDEFRVVYGSAVSPAESDRLYERWAIPAPRWALREPTVPDTLAPAANSSRGPVLLIASGRGQRVLVPAGDVVIFPDRGPSLIIDSGWRRVAESCLSWMDAQEL